jgi:hypothetical protein
MKKSQIKVFFTAGVTTLFLLSGCASGIINTSQSTTTDSTQQKNTRTNNDALITCSVGGIPHSQTMSYESGVYLKDLFSELVTTNAQDPCSAETQQLQKQILLFAEQQGLLPMGMSADMVLAQLEKRSQKFVTQNIGNNLPLSAEGTGREMFCNFVATGEGAAFPIIILPRFIPIIMAPIPRLFVGWKTSEGFTSVGGLVSGTGFYAVGQQQGIALGFWGIGFSIFLPPVKAYGMFGYALFAKASAEHMEYYPPNNPPEITQTDPADGQQMVPTTITELRFEINDMDNDLMTYNVTTEPNIGSGSGGLKPDGTYSIPISGLESLTNYSWYIQLTDGKDTVNKICSFKTEPTTPILSNPLPPDGERDVPVDLSQLRFTLKDYQGDTMDYTVQTSPNIGSAQGTDVHDGTYTVPVSGMTYGATYRWYVNVTDGVHWTRKIFAFETGYPAQFNPFDYGWQYRKQITIDHTKVLEDLTNFPVLISTTDTNLLQKAQTDGGDIMFMNDIGASTRIYHDLESYGASSGTLTVWVKIPFLSSTNDTVFYMYYGNPNCINQAYPEKTWDSNYEAVWHMNDASLTTITDSTSHEYTGTKIAPYGPQQTAGKIGLGQDFDGTDDGLDYTSSIIPTGPKTISVWMKKASDNSGGETMFASSTGGSWNDEGTAAFFGTSNDGLLNWYMGNGASYSQFLSVRVSIPDRTQWHLYTMIYDGSSLTVYTDATSPLSNSSKSGIESNPTYTLRIGIRPIYDYCAFHGTLDEFKISNIARSYEYIATEYNNQNEPTTFLIIGPEEPHP